MKANELRATELRIGNYLESDNKQLRQVTELNSNNNEDNIVAWGVGNDNMFGTPQDYLKPIPLTEEWLLKFGFEYYDNGVGFKAIHYGMNILESDFYFRPSYKGGFYWGWDRDKSNELEDVKPIKYVHQLQNLYFALTGEELNNLNK